ncbi:MAG TPA: hypothetical protein VGM03_07320 [Phycisphaerae bacterium]
MIRTRQTSRARSGKRARRPYRAKGAVTVEWTTHVFREGNQYVAHAMPIDVMSSAASSDAARTALEEAVRLFLLTAADAGTLTDVLEECGYTRRDDAWKSPEFVAVERHTLALTV